MTETESHTPPKRAVVLDRFPFELENEELMNEKGVQDVVGVGSAHQLEKVLLENKDTPFDWVIVRKNIGHHSGSFEDRVRDEGIGFIKRLHEGAYGDYSNSRIVLVTNARDELDQLAYHGFSKYQESVVRLYRNLSAYPETDCVAPRNLPDYIEDICKMGVQLPWKLPTIEELSNMPFPAGVDVHSAEPLDANASKISR